MQPNTFLACVLLATAGSTSAQWSSTSLAATRTQVAAVTVGDYALFAGGRTKSAALVDIDVYDNTTDLWSTASLQVPRTRMSATVVGDRAFFAGGEETFGIISDTVEIYDASLGAPNDPAAWSIETLSAPRALLSATSVGTKAFFAGGANLNGVSDVVDIYDAAVGPPSQANAWSTATLSQPRANLSATSAGTQALFVGGVAASGLVADVDIYDSVTGVWTTSSLSAARGLAAATTTGTHAFFGGGLVFAGPTPSTAVMSNVVDIYDSTTGLWSTTQLSVARGFVSATTVDGFVVFAGGALNSVIASDVVDVFDADSGRWYPPFHLATARFESAATSIGGKAIVAGGTLGFSVFGGLPCPVDTIDVFEPFPSTLAAEVVRLGSPANALAFSSGVSGGPVVGMAWDPVVDHSSFAPAATLDVAIVSVASPINATTSMGTLLCNVPPMSQIVTTSPGTPFSILVPYQGNLVGLAACSQAASFTPGLGFEFTNALDIVIGSL